MCQLCVCVCVCPHALQSTTKRQRALEVAGPCAVNHTFGLTDESEVPLSHSPTHSRPLRTALGHSLTLRLAVFHSFCLYAFRFPPFFFCVCHNLCQYIRMLFAVCQCSFFLSLSTAFTLCLSANLFSSFPLTDCRLKPLLTRCVNNEHIFTFFIFSNVKCNYH